jgi:hypothetical protein
VLEHACQLCTSFPLLIARRTCSRVAPCCFRGSRAASGHGNASQACITAQSASSIMHGSPCGAAELISMLMLGMLPARR